MSEWRVFSGREKTIWFGMGHWLDSQAGVDSPLDGAPPSVQAGGEVMISFPVLFRWNLLRM